MIQTLFYIDVAYLSIFDYVDKVLIFKVEFALLSD